MLRIPCPWCGLRDHSEFAYGGDAAPRRPDPEHGSDEAWFEYVYLRDNPRGPHRELWHHERGCRQWIEVERDTMTHAITGAWSPRQRGQRR